VDQVDELAAAMQQQIAASYCAIAGSSAAIKGTKVRALRDRADSVARGESVSTAKARLMPTAVIVRSWLGGRRPRVRDTFQSSLAVTPAIRSYASSAPFEHAVRGHSERRTAAPAQLAMTQAARLLARSGPGTPAKPQVALSPLLVVAGGKQDPQTRPGGFQRLSIGEAPMTSRAYLVMVGRRFYELDHGNLSILDELFDSQYVLHLAGAARALNLRETKRLYKHLYAAFPDLQHTIEEQVAAGDRVVTRWSAEGTHRREFLGAKPRSRRVTFTGINIYRIAENKLIESHVNWDLLGLFQQLGAVRRKPLLEELLGSS
jgi:predicted ester cyclase